MQFVREARRWQNDPRFIKHLYESLMHDPVGCLLKLSKFLQIDLSPHQAMMIGESNSLEAMRTDCVAQKEGFQMPKAHFRAGENTQIDSLDAYMAEKVAGQLLRELDYPAAAGWWANGILSRVSIPIRHKLRSAINRLS